MEQTKLVPKRRFKEFQNTSAWEQRRLGDVAEISAGGDIDKTKLSGFGKYPVIANALTNDGIIGYYENDFRIEAPAVTVTGRGDVGHAQARKTNFTPVVRLLSVKSKHDVDFLEHAINKHKVLVESTGVPQLTSPQLANYKIWFTSLEEEKKIGRFFCSLDNLITLHQRKLEKMKAIKSAYLSEMFPAEGEREPKRRFAGFTQPWEQRAFSELVTRVTKSSEVDELPRVEYEDIISGQGELNKDIFAKEREKKGIEFTTGDTLFGKLRPYLQNWLFADFKGIAVGDWWVLRPNEMDSKFIYYLIQSDKYQTVANLSTGTKMPRSDWNVVSKTEFFVPVNREEQANIGNFFKQLDNLITLHQRKLEKLQNLKKAYLNEMFV